MAFTRGTRGMKAGRSGPERQKHSRRWGRPIAEGYQGADAPTALSGCVLS